LRRAGHGLAAGDGAAGDERVCEAARALGARFFLHKPVDDQALLDAISWVTGTIARDKVPE
jgi:FixJ family two-component response regulator